MWCGWCESETHDEDECRSKAAAQKEFKERKAAKKAEKKSGPRAAPTDDAGEVGQLRQRNEQLQAQLQQLTLFNAPPPPTDVPVSSISALSIPKQSGFP